MTCLLIVIPEIQNFRVAGDKDILFSDKVMKFTASGKIKRRILLITDVAMYLIDPETNKLKRRVALTAVKKLCLSKLSDGFFAVIVPCEYDCLMLSTRKKQIVDVLIESCSSTSEEMVEFSNRLPTFLTSLSLLSP